MMHARHIQSRVDEYHDAFVKAVARGRHTSTKKVRDNFGQGRMFGANLAKKVGMVDRITTMDEIVDELSLKSALRPKISGAFGAGFYDFVEPRTRLESSR